MKATVVGAGGLGGPIALALGAAGIELRIVDPDVVELSNLHRQIQFVPSHVGRAKAPQLATTVVTHGGVARGYQMRWTAQDADDLSGDCDIVVDGSDDPNTKFAVADWAVSQRKPYVIASALRFGGNVMVGAADTSCYRCLFEAPEEVASCTTAGILGPVVGVIGGLAAALTLGLLHGDRTHAGSIYVFEDLRASPDPRIVRFDRRNDCPACARGSS